MSRSARTGADAALRPRRPPRRTVAGAATSLLLVVATAALPAGATGPPSGYVPPVPGAVVAPFDPPTDPWGAGNRGVDLAAAPGEAVVAAGPGRVSFAGAVAGALHVTVAHADGLRTTYSFLAEVRVVAGQPVAAGEVVGVAGGLVHWGARDPSGAYLDPLSLLGRPTRAVLVPSGEDGAPAPTGGDLLALAGVVAEGLARHPSLAAALVAPHALTTGGGSAALTHGLGRLHSTVQGGELVRAVAERWLAPVPCTPADVVPHPPGGRRIVVLVGGYGSTSEGAAIDDVDVDALGYRPTDVVRFSYRGGRTPANDSGRHPLAALPTTTYGAVDSQGDLWAAGDDLAALLVGVARAEPGVPIDVLAHSQGGVVARLALEAPDLPPEVDAVVTLGTPHQGADLATAAAAVGATPHGHALLAALVELGLPADPSRPALGQLAETSDLVAHLEAHPPPDGVRLTSVAARGDLTVPAPRSRVPGAPPPVVVDLVGPSAHDRLPGSPAAAREVALAVAGLPPSCRGAGDQLVDEAVGRTISWAEDSLGVALAAADPRRPAGW